MDRRLADMPPGTDKIGPTADVPLVLVVAEEWPGLLRAAQARDRKLGDRITSAMLRLASEGRKAAFRVLVLARRFEAAAVGGGYLREQLGLTISFRVPAESLTMLHGDDARELGGEHAPPNLVSPSSRPLAAP
ncbi:hypothetical protein [Actinomycetospora cinnamomea]|uniref:FtsK/SpoIIIE family protein n=1 Tax=Actinomycetospora cinnamomea TaxID=663609 RepID=A0A2U1E9H5_9PSEU|nr:hypothetical protein [Actinomycetospora cinnamomea]PVY96369.1 hypothetical protein C8D89_13019 [Actinomycetospora cinnamomea]